MEIAGQEFQLALGAHDPESKDVCVMEAVNLKWLLEQGLSLAEALEQFTDYPPCTDWSITRAAQVVNDGLSSVGIHQLEKRIDRLMECRTPAQTQRVYTRVACWVLQSVNHLIPPAEKSLYDNVIALLEAWLEEPSKKLEKAMQEMHAEVQTSAVNEISNPKFHAKRAFAVALTPSLREVPAIAATAISTVERSDYKLLDWFDGLLDAWDKAIADEGILDD